MASHNGDDNHQPQPQVTKAGWYVLDEDQQQVGPYAFSELREHFLNRYLSENTFVWLEGRSEWQPLSSVSDLWAQTNQQGPHSSTAVSADYVDEFERWQKEIQEAEAQEHPTSSTEPYGLEEMTFLQEEEIFPTITDTDASEKLEDGSKLSVSMPSLKEEVNEANEANNTNVVADGKRKLSDKETDKKVHLFFPSCLYQRFHPDAFFIFVALTWKRVPLLGDK